MVTALYRRYRPENFAELIGQTQVTDPLRTALRTNRVNHAYLFSGPRGCGKTTSARILARCLNCAEGPTDTPCGVCPSCVELSRDGSGSLDVIEIDAASHNGVDDARDLRDRAIFAPARDRYKIFILDEAHMVTPQGFNALLKIVEEPPEHVKFIFATTEPDKVIGTIRSRTHHYPFRLVPPAQMLDYVGQLCETEGVRAAPGVLPLVVRAGGGSVRDTLSLLDQLMAGSEGGEIEYERAVALLGYTHASLLDAVVDALGDHDGAEAFAAVDRVIQTGQDPRRFVEDLLERLRDLIVVGATTEGAAAVLRGITPEELEHLVRQAHAFGAAELSRSADVVNRALTDMTGATSPRLHLELMIARVLVPESDESGRGALARVERLERRVGVAGDTGASSASVAASVDSTAARHQPATREPAVPPSSSSPAAAADAWAAQAPAAAAAAPAATSASAPAGAPASAGSPEPAPPAAAHSTAWAQTPDTITPAAPAGPVSLQQMRDTWPEILEVLERDKLSAWMVVMTATVRTFDDDVLTLSFPSHNDVETFKRPVGSGEGVSEHLRRAIQQLLGIRVKYIARVERPEEGGAAPGPSATSTAPTPSAETAPAPAATRPTPSPSAEASPTPEVPRDSATEAAASPAVAPAPAASPAPTPASAASPVSAASPAPAAPAAAPSQADRPPAQQSSPTTARSTAPAAPTTGWDVAPIPQSAPPEPDEPEYITEEPPDGVPEADLDPAPSALPGKAPVAPAGTDVGTGTAEAAATTAATPVAPRAAPRTPPRAGGSVPQNSRYGEAVVREILNAQFMHEETIAPRVTPQSGPPTTGSD
ncbi:hypothetical protein GCM10025867_39010 [Frondihabitans sucicola]|uniref:DNA-directed DNA polymerase n=1 Tax=Frondihabitans sucicola TaxID=1268041 RepID=A0ABM8GT62_9MICO|nr:DNA polymerase III subunit gamma and tau [Frondihabitans sucicola]BDZ51660.1 hypothetical protein GCM10025867_39010 [Frondihabitans sucicola]